MGYESCALFKGSGCSRRSLQAGTEYRGGLSQHQLLCGGGCRNESLVVEVKVLASQVTAAHAPCRLSSSQEDDLSVPRR